MKNLILIFITLALLMAGCFHVGNEREGCNGEIIVENEIPDTTLYVGGKDFVRDLSKPPIVFLQTENQDITIQDVKGDINIVSIQLEKSSNSGDLDVLKIHPKKAGETEIEITAVDKCPDGGTTIIFSVVVKNTMQY